MVTPQPPLTPEQRLALEQYQKTVNLKRNLAIGGLIVCPILIALPPRKLDLYTFGLTLGFTGSAVHLYNHARVSERYALPTESAREARRRKLEADMEKTRQAQREGRETEKKRSFLQKLWMGDEEEGWQERRLAAERKALEEGRGYQGVILDQIWEVWNWGGKKGEKKEEESGGSKKE
ncbi:hypothetical protein M011DRAFT_404576 [Sporormia fimetaria CBS 119925]|uniref:Uncharacterized protein n=1 Tax=Sporormia fimetaria CBS 119925 TaxID=1340428 RepID=A0A6A6V6J2_9PLEO|nr:hypothetical protein M011DRAFT_404576 [Sporormia fimetaria CBS 119925]